MSSIAVQTTSTGAKTYDEDDGDQRRAKSTATTTVTTKVTPNKSKSHQDEKAPRQEDAQEA